MIDKEKVSQIALIVVVVFFIVMVGGWHKPTNYLKCEIKTDNLYLKINQRTKIASEYLDKDYKSQVNEFDVDMNENYISLIPVGATTFLDGKSKWPDDIVFINRKTLKIYDPGKKINLGQCTTNDNKI